MKIATYVGAFTAACAALYGTAIIIGTLIWGNPVAGYPSLLVMILSLGGLQLITLGIIGEYLGRIYKQVKRRPLTIIEREIDYNVADSDKGPGTHSAVGNR